MLHVTGARHVLRRDPDDAERALADAETVGRASLDQIRATVAALRTDERGTDPALPGSADLDPLVDEYRRAGLDIDASDLTTQVAALAGPIGTALHRIARERWPTSPGTHRQHRRGQRRRPSTATSGWSSSTTDAPPPRRTRTAGHFGLVGMGERARALGGTLDAQATVDGWRVEARLPILAAPSNELVPS